MTRKIKVGSVLLAALVLLLGIGAIPALAEECVVGVRLLLPWTNAIRGNAGDWPASARKAGFLVDRRLEKGAVLVYPGNYGQGISPLGHVVVIVEPKPINGRITIQDSSPPIPGWPNGWARRVRAVGVPDMNKCWVIHPKR